MSAGLPWKLASLVVFGDAGLPMAGGAEFGRFGVGFVGYIGVEECIGAGGRSVHGAVGVNVADEAGHTVFSIGGSEYREFADPGDEDGFGRVAGVARFFAVRDFGWRRLGRSGLSRHRRAWNCSIRAR